MKPLHNYKHTVTTLQHMKKSIITGILAFLVVLLMMPLGHALMILMEHFLSGSALNWAAFLLGTVGLILTFIAARLKNDTYVTLWAFIGGILLWTGWIEFGYVYFAHTLRVDPLIEQGEVVTKPEYLVLMSSIGFWAIVMGLYIFRLQSGCRMFLWFQKVFNVKASTLAKGGQNKAWTTFLETIMLLWTTYLVLMFAYDKAFLGDDHPITFILAIACLLWSIWLFSRLIRIPSMGPAIRYALPTVMIFWTFVEVMGRRGWLSEFWVEPLHYTFEVVTLFVLLVASIAFIYYRKHHKQAQQLSHANQENL